MWKDEIQSSNFLIADLMMTHQTLCGKMKLDIPSLLPLTADSALLHSSNTRIQRRRRNVSQESLHRVHASCSDYVVVSMKLASCIYA